VPLLVRLGAIAEAVGTVVLGVARTTCGAGVEIAGWEGAGREEEASKSERWFAKVFWD